ncbi:carboxymuconolactone decarboxylase family protein [Legionella hackeliae]|uniref:Alkyl hydroperoxide reductase AhpD n=1 Tax=Legionella hackeliae TaxID=449 RepID=A0A0A8UX98_LEGHA|nr:carboxymuconolactone decarboxylase family protein [Legionella hackeliae]KTD15246.1 alkylhydroperoxidase [Legionella hackeliae]CEK11389.1 Alkyl hydroperoxide reductase AhpD [Legionella hackeliae]STX48161.1 alkylhydroperoxidase [Legionella hackeliae]
MLENIKEQLPEFAKDVRINLGKVLDLTQTDGLSEQQIVGSALAVAYHLGNQSLIRELLALPHAENISESAKLAASLMAMTNVYYRFIHLSEQPELAQIPAGLRMQGMMSPGVDRVSFEVFSLAVSILNGCGACMSAHTRQLKEHGLSAQALARIGRISAVIHSTAVTLGL